MEKVVVTGLGAVSPIGNSAKETWDNLIEGVSGTGPITLFDGKDLLVKAACEVKNFNPNDYLPAKLSRRRARFQQFASVAVMEALEQSGLEITSQNAPRISVIISSGIGGLEALEENIIKMIEEGVRKLNPFLIPMLMSNGAAGLTSIDYGIKGPAISVASACASAQDGIGIALMMLRSEVIDAAIVGGSEAVVTKIGIGAFDRVRAISRKEPDQCTPSPFDKNRDGFVIGEGAGILILESETYAKERGADILGEISGYAATSDAFHITAPLEDGSGGSMAIKAALNNSGIDIQDVDYINAHGTATLLNDLAETKAVKSVFGKRAYEIPISSTKSMTGHIMGATGALEAVFCINAIRDNIAPPTINYQTPDPDCDLDYIPNEARQMEINVAVSNAFGFGGHNAVLAFRGYN